VTGIPADGAIQAEAPSKRGSGRRLLGRLRHAPREQVSIAAVALVLGLLVVGQLRGQAGVPGLSDLSVQELGVLVANLNAHNESLRSEVGSLERQEAALQGAQNRGESAVEALRTDLARIEGWSGATGLAGPGVAITIRGPIGADGVQELLNELRNAGAEGIAVEGVRLVPGVAITGIPAQLAVDGTALGEAFAIRAIGSSQIITGTLTRAGGVIAQLATTYPGAEVTVTPSDTIELPASLRNLLPPDGHPHL